MLNLSAALVWVMMVVIKRAAAAAGGCRHVLRGPTRFLMRCVLSCSAVEDRAGAVMGEYGIELGFSYSAPASIAARPTTGSSIELATGGGGGHGGGGGTDSGRNCKEDAVAAAAKTAAAEAAVELEAAEAAEAAKAQNTLCKSGGRGTLFDALAEATAGAFGSKPATMATSKEVGYDAAVQASRALTVRSAGGGGGGGGGGRRRRGGSGHEGREAAVRSLSRGSSDSDDGSRDDSGDRGGEARAAAAAAAAASESAASVAPLALPWEDGDACRMLVERRRIFEEDLVISHSLFLACRRSNARAPHVHLGSTVLFFPLFVASWVVGLCAALMRRSTLKMVFKR